MITRKIRVSLSAGYEVDEFTPSLVDIDINGSNVDADIEVIAKYGEDTQVFEYTFEQPDESPTEVSIVFRDSHDYEMHNLVIDKVEYADTQNSEFQTLLPTAEHTPTPPACYFYRTPNPDWNQDIPSTDHFDDESELVPGWDPGSNPRNFIGFQVEPWVFFHYTTIAITIPWH